MSLFENYLQTCQRVVSGYFGAVAAYTVALFVFPVFAGISPGGVRDTIHTLAVLHTTLLATLGWVFIASAFTMLLPWLLALVVSRFQGCSGPLFWSVAGALGSFVAGDIFLNILIYDPVTDFRAGAVTEALRWLLPGALGGIIYWYFARPKSAHSQQV